MGPVKSRRHILVAVAWPYAAGSRHLGHMAGAYLPADIFARYHRIAGNRVLMVSGSDVHGTPITVLADREGVEPQAIVDRYHAEFLTDWEKLGISWDLYTSTGTPNHYEVTQDVFSRLLEKGYITEGTSTQLYDPKAHRFLPDRYVEGTCPHCGYRDARGDQCDDCGRTLDAIELIAPRSRMSDATPVTRETKTLLPAVGRLFGDRLTEWLTTREGWRRHVKNWAMGMVNEGLPQRAITRDLLLGSAPPSTRRPAGGPQAHLCVVRRGDRLSLGRQGVGADTGSPGCSGNDGGRIPDAESYYFIGKDNIPFHAVIWPAMLMGYGDLNLPTDVPANQYVTFRQEKASSSRGIGRSVGWYADRIQADALRYALGIGVAGTERHRLLRHRTHPKGERRTGRHLGQPGAPGPVHGSQLVRGAECPSPSRPAGDDAALLAEIDRRPGEGG